MNAARENVWVGHLMGKLYSVICRLQIIWMLCQDLVKLWGILQPYDAHGLVWFKACVNSILGSESGVRVLFSPSVCDHLWRGGTGSTFKEVCRNIWPGTITRCRTNSTHTFARGQVWADKERREKVPPYKDSRHVLRPAAEVFRAQGSGYSQV